MGDDQKLKLQLDPEVPFTWQAKLIQCHSQVLAPILPSLKQQCLCHLAQVIHVYFDLEVNKKSAFKYILEFCRTLCVGLGLNGSLKQVQNIFFISLQHIFKIGVLFLCISLETLLSHSFSKEIRVVYVILLFFYAHNCNIGCTERGLLGHLVSFMHIH